MQAQGSSPSPAPLPEIFREFLRLGLTAFGGPTMVAYIRELAVGKRRWLSEESFRNGVALCQSIPGATAMQTAAYAGLRAGGPWGALAAFVGFGLPAFVLMVLLSIAYRHTREIAAVASAFQGLQLIVIALMANATLSFARSSLADWQDVVLALGAALWLGLRGSPILAVTAAGLLGLFLYRGLGNRLVAEEGASRPRVGKAPYFVLAAVLLVAAGLAALFFADRLLFSLTAMMMKVDLFAFGGGFASVPLMMHEVVDKRQWLDNQVFMDGIALGQVTPGPIVITATFVGHQVAGILGAVVATLGIFAPSFLMVLVAVPRFDRWQHSPLFRRALRGILASFVGLLLAVTVHFGLATSWSPAAVGLAVAAFGALYFRVEVLWVVLVGAVLSALIL